MWQRVKRERLEFCRFVSSSGMRSYVLGRDVKRESQSYACFSVRQVRDPRSASDSGRERMSESSGSSSVSHLMLCTEM